MKKLLFFLVIIFTFGQWTVLGSNMNNEGDGIKYSEIRIKNINNNYSYCNDENKVYLQENGEFKLDLRFFDAIYNDISVRNEDIVIDVSGFQIGEIVIDKENMTIKTNKILRDNKRSEGQLTINVDNYSQRIHLVIQKGSFGIIKIKNEKGDLYNGILMINKYIKPKDKEVIKELEIYVINDGELVLPILQMFNEVEFYGIIAVPISEEDIANSRFYDMRVDSGWYYSKDKILDFGEIVLQKPQMTVYTYLEDGKVLTNNANISVESDSYLYGKINFNMNSNGTGKFSIADLGKKFYTDKWYRDLSRKVILKAYDNHNDTKKVSNEQLAIFDNDKEVKLKYKKDQLILNVLNSEGDYIENGKEFICEIEDLIDKSISEIHVRSENSVLNLSGFEKGHEYKVNIKSFNLNGKEIEERATFNFVYDSEIIRENIKLSYPVIRGKIICDYFNSSVNTEINILNPKRECIYKTESDINGYFNIYDIDLQGDYYIKVLPPKDNSEYSGAIVKKEINLDYDENYVEIELEKSSIYDLNKDGQINDEDAGCLFDEYLNTKRCEDNFNVRYDYNLDGVINIFDVVRLCKNIKE